MQLQKCPRCELNYVKPGEEYCEVCQRETKSRKKESAEAVEMCSACGEHPAVGSTGLCKRCLLEHRRLEKADMQDDNEDDTVPVMSGTLQEMEEIPLDEEEMEELGEELGISEEEYEDDDDLDDEEEENPIEISLDEYLEMEEEEDGE